MNLRALLSVVLLATAPTATAGPAAHTVTATCDYNGVVLVAVAMASGHPGVERTTVECSVGVGPIGQSFSTSAPGSIAVLVEPVLGLPGITCASAFAKWFDGHSASYSEPCPV